MRWEDERYVRVYTRDTIDWLGLSFDAQAVFCLLLRKVDRAGLLPLGRHGLSGVATIIGHPQDRDRIETAMRELLIDGCVRVSATESVLLVPNFIAAQDSAMSEKQRKAESRAKAKDIAAALPILQPGQEDALLLTDVSQNVTDGHENGQNVTVSHGSSQPVTPCRAVPCRAVPKEQDVEPQAALPLLLDIPEDPNGSPVKRVFAHWQRVMDHPRAAFSPERERCIRTALKLRGGAVEDLLLAVDGCKATPFNMGQNDRNTVYDGLSVIFKNSDNVERFMASAKAAKSGTSPKPGNGAAAESFTERDARLRRTAENDRADLHEWKAE